MYKTEYKSRFRILKGGLISLIVSSNLFAAPSGGTVTMGTGTINQSGKTTTIEQISDKLIINWDSFNIANGETVNFNQPNSNSITLNRVVGNEKSIIDGALNANGQVWILNSNGTLFGKNAKVNTSGLLVTTKNLSDKDFQDGNYNFKGNSKASIENQGDINLNDKAYAVFVANSVINNGEIKVHKGTIQLSGANEFSVNLDENSNISLKVTKGVLNSLVENNNLIVANGGNVYLTTNAKNELLKGVVNNKGIIEAASLDDLKSEVIIYAHGGTANISGTIEAKGGFIETSGKSLSVTSGAKIVAGTWLIDPVNVTIEANGGNLGEESESVSATAIQSALSSGNVTIQADENIYVNEKLHIAMNTLTLGAGNSIYINKEISTGATPNGLILNYAKTNSNGDYYITTGSGGKILLGNNSTFKTKKGSSSEINWTIINTIVNLANINFDLNGNYVLGNNLDLIGNKVGPRNWTPIGGFIGTIGDGASVFRGRFDGLGNTISNMDMYEDNKSGVGFFATTSGATIQNIGLLNTSIKVGGSNHFGFGALVGIAENTIIKNSYSTGEVLNTLGIGRDLGGLVGTFVGSSSVMENSYSTTTVVGFEGSLGIGGLVGFFAGETIKNSYATGNVSGAGSGGDIGGLVGMSEGGVIKNSYAIGKVVGNNNVGGLIGNNVDGMSSTNIPENSFYDKTVNSTLTENNNNIGKTTEELQSKDTFTSWNIGEDSTLEKGTPILSWQKDRNDNIWIIGTKTTPPPEPNPNPNPNPTPNPNSDIQKIVDSIDRLTNVNTPNQQFASNFASNQNSGLSQTDNSSELSQNPNIRVLALSNNQNISIVNGGIKMPDGVDNTSEENK